MSTWARTLADYGPTLAFLVTAAVLRHRGRPVPVPLAVTTVAVAFVAHLVTGAWIAVTAPAVGAVTFAAVALLAPTAITRSGLIVLATTVGSVPATGWVAVGLAVLVMGVVAMLAIARRSGAAMAMFTVHESAAAAGVLPGSLGAVDPSRLPAPPVGDRSGDGRGVPLAWVLLVAVAAAATYSASVGQ